MCKYTAETITYILQYHTHLILILLRWFCTVSTWSIACINNVTFSNKLILNTGGEEEWGEYQYVYVMSISLTNCSCASLAHLGFSCDSAFHLQNYKLYNTQAIDACTSSY